jgi:hypothetical protein
MHNIQLFRWSIKNLWEKKFTKLKNNFLFRTKKVVLCLHDVEDGVERSDVAECVVAAALRADPPAIRQASDILEKAIYAYQLNCVARCYATGM